MTSGLVRGAASVAALFVFSVVAVAALFVFSVVAVAAPPSERAPAQQATVPDVSSPANKADPTKPDVATLLFGTPQWNKAPVGSKLRYSFEKTTADAALGPGFKDDVVLTLGAGDDAESRTTEVQLFTGANRKPAGPFRSDKQNPVLLVILENNVQEMSKLFQANPRYLKNAIRKAWRDKPKIESVTDMVDGKAVAATRVSVSPFVGDLEADRMKGLSSLTYVVDVANDVPGGVVAIDIHAADGGKTLFSETLHYLSEIAP